MAPVAHPISINQDFRFDPPPPYGSAAHPLCADLISERFTPTREQHIFDEDVYFRPQTNLKMKLSSDKKILHANLFQRIQARSSEINIATGLQTFPREFLRITFKI